MNVNEEARKYLSEEVKTVDEAIQGAQDIIAERISIILSIDNVYLKTFIIKERLWQQRKTSKWWKRDI